ncbi:hypothetical protein FH609_010345 [Streptomyces sp. 3MP-14]|uniref:Uncharacterized protein n=1 Tax=Streptomyces mimosae TaxID=2586635 RepID=A0A5N6AJ27_9ACTN|nr:MULTISPECIES: hypothetical protein [Streptomyces]KAB8167759.1 hypothetical protein FH607_007075 [Streptomyces mimosae]KAB8177593.1 hypothetical protein FH609_010345 [Streptomyces sp. 3MP-14]
MAKRFLTRDGRRVGVGDRVWSANHLPWVVRRIGPMSGMPAGSPLWAFMDRDPSFPAQPDLDDTLFMAEEDFPTYVYRSHPSDGGCARAGCRHRPWGAVR